MHDVSSFVRASTDYAAAIPQDVYELFKGQWINTLVRDIFKSFICLVNWQKSKVLSLLLLNWHTHLKRDFHFELFRRQRFFHFDPTIVSRLSFFKYFFLVFFFSIEFKFGATFYVSKSKVLKHVVYFFFLFFFLFIFPIDDILKSFLLCTSRKCCHR